ncbi:MAG: hypothetical protein ACK40O_03615 [Allosphingosinicella sp.]
MNGLKVAAALASLLCSAAAAAAEPRAGEVYEIVATYETSSTTSDGSSSSSRGGSAIQERVVAVRPDGVELEYDLPAGLGAEERAHNWRLPARVLARPGGPMQLLNASELETRLDAWLKAAGWTREVCGRWIFTWNAFFIECDPQSILKELQALDLRSLEGREGAVYADPHARAPAVLKRASGGAGGETFVAVLEIDPAAARRARAESDVAVGEILGKPVTLEAALEARAKERLSGTLTVTLETDPTGAVRRLTRRTEVETERADGESEAETRIETIERIPKPEPPAGR